MLAELELHQGHSETAFTYAEEGMQASEGINDRWCKGIIHSIFGKIESKQSNFERACMRYHISIVLLREAGDVRSQADVMADSGAYYAPARQIENGSFLIYKEPDTL